MQRRTFLKAVSVPATASLAGCSSTSDEEGTPATQGTAEAATGTATATAEPTEPTEPETETETETPRPSAEPLDWGTYAKNAGNTKFAPSQPLVEGPYERDWSRPEAPERSGAPDLDGSRLVAGGGRLYVQPNREGWGSPITAFAGDGEALWQHRQATLRDLSYAQERVAGVTREGGVLVLNAETGERETLMTDVIDEDNFEESQMTPAGLYVLQLRDYDTESLVVVDVTAGEVIAERTLENMVQLNATLAEGQRIHLLGSRSDSGSYEQRPFHVETVDARSGETVDSFSQPWLQERDMDYVHYSLLHDGTFFSTTVRESSSFGGSDYLGMIAYDTDGSLQWAAPELFENAAYFPPAVDESNVYVPTRKTITALDRETGEVQWSYSNTAKFSPSVLATGDRLLAFDWTTSQSVRLHSIDPGSGEATRTELYTESDYSHDYSSGTVRIRPATQGFYVMGTGLHHIVSGTDE